MNNQISNKSKSITLNLDKVKSKLGNKETSTINNNNSIWIIPNHVINESGWRSNKRKLFYKYALRIVESGNNKEVNLQLELINFLIDYEAFFLINDFKAENFCKSKSTNVEKKNRINKLYSDLLINAKQALEDSKLTLSEIVK